MSKDFELYESCLFKIALSLTYAYMMRFVRGQWKQVPKDEYESIIRPMRTWHLEDVVNNRVDREIIIKQLNSQTPQFLNKLIRRMLTNQTQSNNQYNTTSYKKKKRLLQPGFAKNHI